PDGTIIAALHWNEALSDENNKVLASGFPGAGLQSSVAASAENVQFMAKDSKKYAATGGWGFADFKNGKPGDEALHKTCFPCHQPAKDGDYVHSLRAYALNGSTRRFLAGSIFWTPQGWRRSQQRRNNRWLKW